MSPESAPAVSTGPESRRQLLSQLAYQPSRPHLLIGALFLFLGLLVTVVVLDNDEGEAQWRTARAEDLIRVLDDLGARSTRLAAETQRLTGIQRDLESGSTAQALAETRRQLEALRVMAGTTPVTGPGIEVTIADPDGALDAAVLIDAVQELRDAGAEAIMVGDQRVVVDTWFADTADGVTVGGVPLGDAFTIRAIGDPDTMVAAVNIPGGFAESVRTRGSEFTATTAPSLTISVTVPVQDPSRSGQ